MKTEHIDIKTADGVCDSFAAYPGNEKYPGVLLYMDAFGPRQYLFDMAQRLAAHGYYVLVPNMFYRVRRAPVVDLKFPLQAEDMADIRKHIMPLFQTFSAEKAMSDAGSFLGFMSEQSHVRPGKLGATGYCMGGTLAIRTAGQFSEKLAAAASYHAGNLASDADDSPHKLLPKIKCELYIAHADNDQSMPQEQIEKLEVALEESRVKYVAETYEGASHGFTMADLPAYNMAALERHWVSLLDLLDRNLKSAHLRK